MKREIAPALQALYDAGKEVYSISRLNTMEQCKYQAYMQYIDPDEFKSEDGVYGFCGGRVHDALEQIVAHGADISELQKAIDKTETDIDILGYAFPKDRQGNDTIREHWFDNARIFAEHYKPPTEECECERLLILPVDDMAYLQGYADLIIHHGNRHVTLVDYKTSTEYRGDAIKHAGRQLIVYKKALELDGYMVDKVGWLFTKYFDVEYELKSGAVRRKHDEWRKYTPYNNEHFLKPYFCEYKTTPELEQECMDYLKHNIELFRTLGKDAKNYPPCDINEDSFFCNNLCGFRKTCKYLKEFNSTFVKEDKYADLF